MTPTPEGRALVSAAIRKVTGHPDIRNGDLSLADEIAAALAAMQQPVDGVPDALTEEWMGGEPLNEFAIGFNACRTQVIRCMAKKNAEIAQLRRKGIIDRESAFMANEFRGRADAAMGLLQEWLAVDASDSYRASAELYARTLALAGGAAEAGS